MNKKTKDKTRTNQKSKKFSLDDGVLLQMTHIRVRVETSFRGCQLTDGCAPDAVIRLCHQRKF
jgi:hypothetical protein